ncbi:MAG TPA: beta-ketoacyl-[acyl-carrier-protein] synthase family protein [Polyangiaceae bacterium]|jgi:3-oxoacyl-[acyl-carrier-protein] synthase II
MASPIAVTAMTWTTALGDDLHAVWQRLLAGETGFSHVPCKGSVRNDLVAPVPGVPLELPAADRMTKIGLPALRRALAEAERDARDPGVTLVLGTSLGAFLEDQSPPLHAWADELARAVDAVTPPISVSTACSSGSDAILVGAELIRTGAARCCICGGVDVITTSKRLAHSALGTMSPTELRAFDVRHDGTLIGEGAAFVVLEAEPHASAPALATLRGAGSANDASGMTTPDPNGRGARFAVERSLADAGLSAGAIDLVNAHGSGTPLNDATEALALRDLFVPAGAATGARPVVFGTKGNFGHSLGATGAIEAIALILAMRTGQIPPVAGLEQPDPAFPLPLPRGEPLRAASQIGLSLTLGFGGFDTSLVFEVTR